MIMFSGYSAFCLISLLEIESIWFPDQENSNRVQKTEIGSWVFSYRLLGGSTQISSIWMHVHTRLYVFFHARFLLPWFFIIQGSLKKGMFYLVSKSQNQKYGVILLPYHIKGSMCLIICFMSKQWKQLEISSSSVKRQEMLKISWTQKCFDSYFYHASHTYPKTKTTDKIYIWLGWK